MKKLFAVLSLIPFLTFAQPGKYGQPEAGSGGISTATARQNTGWTSNGTLARDTLATNYALFGAKTFGVGGTTQAQNARAKFNVLGRASADTLLIVSNEGNTSATGDSVVYVLQNGAMSIASTTAYGGLSSATRLNVGGDVRLEGNTLIVAGSNAQVQFNSSAQRIYYDPTNKLQFFVAGAATHVMDDNGYVGINNAGLKSRNQGVLTIRGNATADTTFIVRNDVNSTLDSTFMVFANGGAYVGGNNLYFGANRIRSVTGDTAFVFYAGSTQVFAILADGSTADLVAGTPPSSRRYNPPPDYIWLLRIGVLLLLLLVAFKVHDYIYKADEMKWKIIRSGIRGKS